MNAKKTQRIALDILALIAGVLSITAFAPLKLHYVALITPALLLITINKTSSIRALWRGFLFGLGLFGTGASWFYVSIHVYGGTNAVLAAFFTLCPVLVLAVLPGLATYFLNSFWKHNTAAKVLLCFPAAMVLAEWVQQWIFTGFPWLQIGDTQATGMLAGFVPIIGRIGTSWAVFLTAGFIYLIFSGKTLARLLSLLGLLIMLALGIGLTNIHWTQATGKTLRVSLVQGNIHQDMHWDPAYIQQNIKTYIDLSEPYWHTSQLIIWPENAIPVPPPYSDDILQSLKDTAFKNHSALITGIPIATGDNDTYYNSLIGIGNANGHYFKRHLVPFGEYLPFRNQLKGLLNFFNLPMSDFIPGPKNQNLVTVNGITIAPFICYEIAFSNLILKDLPHAQLIIVVSNDAWFGHSFAAAQHVQIAQMQALATGREILFGTNNGVTAVIGVHGEILKQIPRFQAGVLSDQVEAFSGSTPWVYIGNYSVLILMMMLIGVGFGFRDGSGD